MDRLAREIWADSVAEGERRMGRSIRGHAATGILGGFDVVIGLVLVVSLTAALDAATDHQLGRAIGALSFGVAFVLLKIGRSELFTENFLVPVVAVMARRKNLVDLGRMWSLTLLANFAGATLLAALASVDGVLPPGASAVAGDYADIFAGRGVAEGLASAVIAGMVFTLYTWLTVAARGDGSRIALALLIGPVLLVPGLNHVVVSYCEMILGVLSGAAHPGVWTVVRNLGVAAVGNAIGGIGFITLIRMVQVGGEPSRPEAPPSEDLQLAGPDRAPELAEAAPGGRR